MRKLAFFLAALLALGAASCSQTPSAPVDTTAADTSGAPVETEPAYQLPEGDFGGRDVNFFLSDFRTLIQATEENGDTINDAVYRRNRKVEELYNVNFKYTAATDVVKEFPKWWATAEASILAGDNSIDILGGYFYRLAAIGVTNEYFHNLNDMPQIDFDQPWWIGDLQNAASIGSKLYICTGNIDPGFYNRIYVMMFNKELAKSAVNTDFYELVRSGKWTFEALQSAAKSATVDLNGDSVMDDKDQYGLLLGCYMQTDAFNNAFDIQFIEHDNDGLPVMLPLTEHLADAATALREFARHSGHVFFIEELDFPAPQYTMFEEGRALLSGCGLGNLQKMRDCELDFGILPYPKWDEAQKDYISYAATDPVGGYCVPITADAELAGCLLEALAYYGWEDVYPEFYERALKGKNTRDDESAEMLDLIFETLRFGFIQTYTYAIGDGKSPSMMLRSTLRNDSDIASVWAANEENAKNNIQKIIDALK